MKKSLFLMGLGALTLASCSQEEVIQVNPNKANDGSISFQARIGKASRAAELTTDNLQEFGVFAYKGYIDDLEEGETLTEFFNGSVVFKRDETPNDEGQYTFSSDKKYYLPVDESLFTFLAYAPVKDDIKVESTNVGELKFNDFTVNDNIEEQVDLLAACCPVDGQSLYADNASGFPMTFSHMLSKVYVSSAWNGNEDYTYEVAGIKLGNIAKSGNGIFNIYDHSAYKDEDGEYTCEVPYAVWTPSEPNENLVYIFDEPVTIGESHTPLMSGGIDDEGNVDKKGAFLVIPQEVNHSMVGQESGTVEGGTAEESVTTLEFKEGVAYVALLIRITNNKTGDVMYPYAKGTDNVSETIDGVKYAWAAFPIASTWTAGFFTDYVVDFSDGAGFIPGEAEGYIYETGIEDETGEEVTYKIVLAYKPVLGGVIRFIEEVNPWYDGNQNTLGHSYDNESHTYEAVMNAGGVDDPFGE